MTTRRYYTDAYTREFPARVVDTPLVGDRPAAILDQTFFYPTSGGQPHDTGRLGAAAVVDVAVREADGAVLHLLDAPLDGGPVEGRIDWSRRFDHMQQHTGQHILSQAFLRITGAPTIGFHLGADAVSIDLGITDLGEAGAADAEALANDIVTANASVRAWFPSAEELSTLTLRKAPEVDGPLRLVAVGDFDLSACGGTHVASTGEIGLISILRTERMKRGVRIEFLCGGRARADYARKHRVVRELASTLTCSPLELPASVSHLQGALLETRRELATLKERELDAEAARRVAEAPTRGNLKIVRAAWEARPIDEVKGLALRLTTLPGTIVLFGIAGKNCQILVGRSEAVDLDLKPCFERILSLLGGGRGGGARVLQGAAGTADLATLEAALRNAEEEIAGSSA